MSIRIGLNFETKIDLEFLSAGVSVRLVRLFASVQLQAGDGWTPAYKAIVDTGNPISVIPRFIWSQADTKPLFPKRVSFQGIGSGRVSGELTEVCLVFVDPKRVSPPIEAKAFLLGDDSVPFLIKVSKIS